MTQASLPISLNDISQDKILRFKQHPQLLEALDQWVTFADRRLIPQMQVLGELVKGMYKLPNEIKLFRGFRLGSFQDSLGFDESAHIGQVTTYESDEKSLSFSTDESIAKAFGNVIVTTTLNTKKAPFLVITDELNVIIHEMRNLRDLMTQKEVVLLPPIQQQLKVVSFENPNQVGQDGNIAHQ